VNAPSPSSVGPQSPPPGRTNIDHLAHFVPDREACLAGLQALGFAPTPFSPQLHRLAPDAPLTEAGTGNHCVMLRAGYLEFLAPIAETPVAAQLRASMARYVGVHSIVFGSPDARADHARLEREGYAPLPLIGLQRNIRTERAEAVARFSVVRVPPGTMAEGRIQYCQHHTEALVWQPRWLDHPNAAVALRGVFVCVRDLEEAAARYARFVGVQPAFEPGRCRLVTDRGVVELYDRDALAARFGLIAPLLPWIGGCILTSAELSRTRRAIAAGGLEARELGRGHLLVPGPVAVGGNFLFVDA